MTGPLNYTTKVPTSRTLAEVQDLLAQHGADAVAITYRDRRPAGVRFVYDGQTFELPADTDAMAALLAKSTPNGGVSLAVYRSPEHAERVCWRVVKDWIAAQMALIAARQATLDEVMLPYLITSTGRPLRDDYRHHLALEAPDA